MVKKCLGGVPAGAVSPLFEPLLISVVSGLYYYLMRVRFKHFSPANWILSEIGSLEKCLLAGVFEE